MKNLQSRIIKLILTNVKHLRFPRCHANQRIEISHFMKRKIKVSRNIHHTTSSQPTTNPRKQQGQVKSNPSTENSFHWKKLEYQPRTKIPFQAGSKSSKSTLNESQNQGQPRT